MEKLHLLLLGDIVWFRSSASRSIFSASCSHRINKVTILFRKETWNTMLLCMCLNIMADPPSSVVCQGFQSLFPHSAFSCFALLVWNFSQWKLFFSFQLTMPSQTELAKIKSVRSSNFSPPPFSSSDKSVKVWDASSRACINTFFDHQDQVTLRFFPLTC